MTVLALSDVRDTLAPIAASFIAKPLPKTANVSSTMTLTIEGGVE
jgi:hypothetical protein